jgi:hypothetical protein
VYKLFRLGFGGVSIIAVGIWLMTSPDMRQNPNVVTASDLMPGIAAVLIGTLLLGLAVYSLFRR